MTDYRRYILSTGTHYISNSGSDERGKYTGGKAGDQNGGEWALKKWYSRPWTVVLRWPDQRVGTCIAQLGIEAALNDLIGYDQSQRATYWSALKAAGYHPSRITTACEEDCTAGVTANVKAAGELLGISSLKALPTSCSSRNMRQKFTAAGFKALTEGRFLAGPNHLMPGDILLYESHHAATNVTHGSLAGAYEYVDVLNNPGIVPPQTDVAPANPTQPDGSIIVNTVGSYWLREEPSLLGAKIRVVQDSTPVRVYGRTGSWYGVKLVLAGTKGYISHKALPGLEVVHR